MKKTNLLTWISTVLSLLFALGVMTVFRACAKPEDGDWMNCHYVQRYLFLLALGLAAVELLTLAVRAAGAVTVLEIVRIAAAVFAMVLPGGIMHMCMMDTMRCHALMKPFTYVMCVLLIALALARIALARRVRAAQK